MRYTLPWLGHRRTWLLTTQILLIISIAGMGFIDSEEHLWWLAAVAVLVAFCSASQDIIFDAYKTDLLSTEERGAGAAISVMDYRISMLVSGGLALCFMVGRSFCYLAATLSTDGQLNANWCLCNTVR